MSTWSYQAPSEFSDEQFACWQSLLQKRTGICLARHKPILQTGLSQRMRAIGKKDTAAYFKQLSAEPEDGAEWSQLVDCISVQETRFFRNPQSINTVYLYLDELLQQHDQARSLELWSVGCSTGEEAYSLAIIASEAIEQSQSKCSLAVRATDISHRALTVARLGCYPRQQLQPFKPDWLNRYVVPSEPNGYQMHASLRQQVNFEQANLQALEKLPKLAMDAIYCQNVLIYFQRERQLKVLDELVAHLKPGGLLIVGCAEASSWRHPQVMRTADKSVQAYIKKKVGSYE